MTKDFVPFPYVGKEAGSGRPRATNGRNAPKDSIEYVEWRKKESIRQKASRRRLNEKRAKLQGMREGLQDPQAGQIPVHGVHSEGNEA